MDWLHGGTHPTRGGVGPYRRCPGLPWPEAYSGRLHGDHEGLSDERGSSPVRWNMPGPRIEGGILSHPRPGGRLIPGRSGKEYGRRRHRSRAGRPGPPGRGSPFGSLPEAARRARTPGAPRLAGGRGRRPGSLPQDPEGDSPSRRRIPDRLALRGLLQGGRRQAAGPEPEGARHRGPRPLREGGAGRGRHGPGRRGPACAGRAGRSRRAVQDGSHLAVSPRARVPGAGWPHGNHRKNGQDLGRARVDAPPGATGSIRMSACKEHREKLGEFLVGALDPRASDKLERHIEGCRECSAELAELQRLEGVLWSAEPARAARPRRSRPLAAAAAVLIAAGIAGTALVTSTGGGPRLVDGEIAGVRAGPGRLPLDQPLWITRSSRIVIPGVASIDAAAGARVYVHGDRAVRLDAGEAFFSVEPGRGGFTAETPLGTVEVPGTSFGIEIVEEGEMSGNVVRGAAAAAVIVSVGSGAIIWKGLGDEGPPVAVEAGKVGVARPGSFEVKDPVAEAKEIEGVVKTLRAERDSIVAGTKELAERLAELSAEAEALGEKDETSKEAEEAKALRLAFGPHSDLEVLRGTDWRALGQAASKMSKLLDELVGLEKPFAEAPQELLVQIGIENTKLVPIVLELIGKLPTHAGGNGEFTYPLVHWNILAEALDQAGLPLSDDQLHRMASLGEEYDSAWEALQGSYGADALAVEKILDELGLKKKFRDRLDGILEARQREALGSPGIRHRAKLDLYSPMLILAGAPTIDGRSREEI